MHTLSCTRGWRAAARARGDEREPAAGWAGAGGGVGRGAGRGQGVW